MKTERESRLTPDEEWNRLPQWIKTIVDVRFDTDNDAEAARRTGHSRATVAKYWKLHKHLLKRR